MSQPEKTGILYGQIISQVIADAKQRFEEEGVDMAVLTELEKVSRARAGVWRAAARRAGSAGWRSPRARASGGSARWVLSRGDERARGAFAAGIRAPPLTGVDFARGGYGQLWQEKLQQSGIVGAGLRGSGGVGGAGGYHQHHYVQHKAEDHGLRFPSGAPPARMAPSHAGSGAYGKVNIKHELPQTDGADVAEGDAGVAASRPGRRPRRGDYVEVEVSMGGGPAVLNLQQLDGAGSGPRKRKLEDDGAIPRPSKTPPPCNLPYTTPAVSHAKQWASSLR